MNKISGYFVFISIQIATNPHEVVPRNTCPLLAPPDMWSCKKTSNSSIQSLLCFIMKTHVTLIFTRSVGTLQPTRPLCRVGSKLKWPRLNLKSKYNQLIVSKLSRKSAICPRRSPWRLIVLVRSLRSARLDNAWLVKSVTYFNLIG